VAVGYDETLVALGVIAAIGMTLHRLAIPETGRCAATPGLPRTGEANR
jgi:hypothetical protein